VSQPERGRGRHPSPVSRFALVSDRHPQVRFTRARLIFCSILVGFAAYGSALAEEAYTSKSANLRAGPGRDYPIVSRIPPGSSVEVAGCLEDYAWCDVIAGPDRGWMYSGSLEYPYEGRRVAILQEGPAIGLPVVVFSVGPYWDTYYRGRPWYARRTYWAARPLPQHRTWVRPPAPGLRSQGPRPSIARRPESLVVRPPGPRPSEPRASGPRPAGPGHDRAQVRPSRPAEHSPAQARPQNRQAPPRSGKPEEERKRGSGSE
jgi:uncharacterized protein YraI